MAILGLGKKKEEKKKKEIAPESKVKEDVKKKEVEEEKTIKKQSPYLMPHVDYSSILLRPRVTEKATFAAEHGVYVFEVSPRSTKRTISEAIKNLYKVTPIRVNIVKLPPKQRISHWRKTRGVKPGIKKAYIHLKKGDSIDIV